MKIHLQQTTRAIGWCLLASLLLPRPSIAAESPPNIIFSEVNWAGSAQSNADEWLELQSLEEETIDLSGWSIEGAATSGGTLTLPAGATIAAGKTYLISNYAQNQSTLAATPDFVTTAVALSNSGLRLILRDSAHTEIDAAGDGGIPPAGLSGRLGFASMIRSGDGWVTATSTQNFDDGVNQFGTPGVADVALPEVVAVKETEEVIAPAEEPVIETAPITEEASPTADEPIIEPTPDPSSKEWGEIPEVGEETMPETNSAEPNDEEQSTIDPPILTYSPHDLLINEVVSDPAEGNEWVEIYNPYDNVIPLEGWSVGEAGGTAVDLDGLIGEQQFVSVEFKNKLNNDGDDVTLHDPTGAVVDEISFDEIDKGSSLARDENDGFVLTTEPTRNEENLIVEPVVEVEEKGQTEKEEKQKDEQAEENNKDCHQATVRLVNLFPDPLNDEESGEFITIENAGEEEVCLDGWRVNDASTSYKLAGKLLSHLRLELPRTVTKIALNNTSAETVQLVNPDGEVIDTVSYDQATADAIYTQTDTGWVWLLASTQSTAVQCPDHQEKSDGTAEATSPEATGDVPSIKTTTTSKKKRASAAVESVEGVVIAAPGTFSSQTMYIDGLQLYQYTGDFPDVDVGDVVTVHGLSSSTHGEPRLKLSSSESLALVGADAVEPSQGTIGELDDLVGHLVQVEGTVVRRSGDRLTLEDGGEDLTIIAKAPTGVSFSSLAVGANLTVTGVLTTYDGSLRLLPRSSEDVVEVPQPEAEEISSSLVAPGSGIAPKTVGLSLAGITTSAVGARAWWYRRKKKLRS